MAIAVLLIVVVAAIFALVALGTVRLPDVNSRSGPGSNTTTGTTVGYVDARVTLDFEFALGPVPGCTVNKDGSFTGCYISVLSGQKPVFLVDEHLTMPTAPATIFRLPLGTNAVACTAKVDISVTGPGLSPVFPPTSSSDPLSFIPSETRDFAFGHLYLPQQGPYTLTFSVFVWGCYQYPTVGKVDTVVKSFQFDGVNE